MWHLVWAVRVGLRAKWYHLEEGPHLPVPVFRSKSIGRGAACLHVRAPTLPLRVDPKTQTGSRLEKGGTKGTLGLTGPLWSSLQMSLPSSSPAGGSGLTLGQQQQHTVLCSLPAVGSTRLTWPSWRFDQNVLKVFPQIVSFNFNKSYLALRALAMWKGKGYVLKAKSGEWVLCEGLLRAWCGLRDITSSLRERSPCHVIEKHGGIDRGSTLTEKCSFRLNNKFLHAHTD